MTLSALPHLGAMLLAATALLVACGDDDPPYPPTSPAVASGVGIQCATDADCQEANQSCLDEYKDGYCSVRDCTGDIDCPGGSACVTHDDGSNYCFLLCVDKPDCNQRRPPDGEANCSGSVNFVDGGHSKACIPPSG